MGQICDPEIFALANKATQKGTQKLKEKVVLTVYTSSWYVQRSPHIAREKGPYIRLVGRLVSASDDG